MQKASAIKRAPVDMQTAFGITLKAPIGIAGFEPNDIAPKPNPGYVFKMDRLRDLTVFWETGFTAMKLTGDPAAGKTSLVKEWHARLNAPLAIVSCSGGTQEHHLYGQLLPDVNNPGALRWNDGPVVAAARHGTSVLLDEYNTLDPNVATKLNAILEGYPVVIEETGEQMYPAAGFRVFATENSVYSKQAVTGRNIQDAANDDRWMAIEVEYLDKDAEIAVVRNAMIAKKASEALATATAPVIVACAHAIRKAFRERFDEQAQLTSTERDLYKHVERPMSTRTACRWGILTDRYRALAQQGKQPLLYALPRAFASQHEDMAQAVLTIVRQTSGL